MTKALRLVVAIVVGKAFVLLGTVVPGQLQQAFTITCSTFLRNTLGTRVAEEVEVETRSSRFTGPEKRHAQDFLVEFERLLGILDTDHGVVLISEVSDLTLVNFRYQSLLTMR